MATRRTEQLQEGMIRALEPDAYVEVVGQSTTQLVALFGIVPHALEPSSKESSRPLKLFPPLLAADRPLRDDEDESREKDSSSQKEENETVKPRSNVASHRIRSPHGPSFART